MPEERKCPKCNGVGTIDNQVVHRKLKCMNCNGTGKVVWTPKREMHCPKYCNECKYVDECEDALLEERLVFPPFNTMSDEVIDNYLNMARMDIIFVVTLVTMTKYPNSSISIGNTGIQVPEGAVRETPTWKGYSGLYLELCCLLGSSFRNNNA